MKNLKDVKNISKNLKVYDALDKDITFISGIFENRYHLSEKSVGKFCSNNTLGGCKCSYWITIKDLNDRFFCFENDEEEIMVTLGLDPNIKTV